MVQTSRITSGFDIEFQLGGGWFRTALNGLAERGLLIPAGTSLLVVEVTEDTEVSVTDVRIDAESTDRDLAIELTVGPFEGLEVGARIALSEDGSELTFTHDFDDEPVVVPFDALSDLAGPPVLVKLAGSADHEAAMAVLANLDMRASGQGSEPLPDGEHLDRGDSMAAQSFLPVGKHVALGVGDDALKRFANDIWHTQLTDDDGSQPFPDEDDPQGDWKKVSMSAVDGRIRVKLEAKVEIDTPLIDVIPDPDVTITVDLIPVTDGGELKFELKVDASIDFGLLGDLLAGFVGGVIGFVIGLFTGNPFGGALAGAAAGVVILEVGEYVVGKVIAREVQAGLDGAQAQSFYSCRNSVVHRATVVPDNDGLVLGFLDAIPTSIPLHIENPDPLFARTVVVSSEFDEITGNGSGFALAGECVIGEIDMPVDAKIVDSTMGGEELTGLTYRTSDGTEHTLELEEVLDRAASDEVPEPLSIVTDADGELEEHKQPGRLPVACMHPIAIHREKTVIKTIRFDTGLELDTQDTIALQDGGALLLPGLQLIHPSNANPYYRAPADDSTDNNFESLPEF